MEQPSESPEEKLQCLMYENKFDDIFAFLKDSKNKNVVEKEAMNLVSVVCSVVKENNEFLKNPTALQNCTDVLMYLIERGNPKEVLIGLLESADSFKEDEYFLFLLDPLKRVFTGMPGKRGKSLEWLLSVLNAHVLSLPRPKNQDLEGKELLLMDLDPAVQRTSDILSGYIGFLKSFVEEVSFETVAKTEVHYVDRVQSQRLVLQKYLLSILEYPLLYHDLHLRPNQALSSIQNLCVKVVEYLQKISKNFFDLYKLVGSTAAEVDSSCDGGTAKSVSELAAGNLSYLMFAENLAPCCRPHVYRHSYLFEMHISYVSRLLDKNENLVVYKGLHLCDALLNRLPDSELPTLCSKLDQSIQLSRDFFNIAIYSSVKELRTLAVSLFAKYVKKFRWRERYIHLMHVLTSIPHPGVQGLIVNMYKDFLYTEITDDVPVKCFSGKNLHSFMRMAVQLKDGVKTDILENYDLIVSCLNLVRFLVLCDDKRKNATGFWDMADSVTRDYLEPLHQGIELTRAHYKLATKNVEESKKTGPHTIASVTVNDKPLPDLPPDYKAVVLEKAMLSLDMVESVLSRVKELLEKAK